MPSNTYHVIVGAAEAYLRSTNSVGPASSKSNKQVIGDIKSKVKSGHISIDATDGTMLAYLSYAANNDPESRIVSGGSWGGYWIDPSESFGPEAKPEDEEKLRPPKGKALTVFEKDLYPLVELWLQTKGYTSKDMSTLKSGGKWGNPDIIGANRVELFGSVEVELASCEVKLREAGWEQMIFEAISHKRFSNRSWFCYRVDDKNAPIPKGMEAYAERYRVGIVQIVLSEVEFADLKTGSKGPLDYIDQVIERVPALYDTVSLREKRDLVDRTGITLSLSF